MGEGAVRDDDGSGAVPTPYIGCGLLLVQLFTSGQPKTMLREKPEDEHSLSLLPKAGLTPCFFDSYTYMVNVWVAHHITCTEDAALVVDVVR